LRTAVVNSLGRFGAGCSYRPLADFIPAGPYPNGPPNTYVGSIQILFEAGKPEGPPQIGPTLTARPIDRLGDMAWEIEAPHIESVLVRQGDYEVLIEVGEGRGESFTAAHRLAVALVPQLRSRLETTRS
jgi:hypothetical protein